MNEVSIVIKTFNRPKALERLHNSIRKFYPEIRIIIVDDGDVPISEFAGNTEVIKAPFDIGLSAGRNLALEHCSTPFFLLVDDDFIFTKETDLVEMKRLLEANDVDILAGALTEDGKTFQRYEGDLIIEGQTLYYRHSRPQVGRVTRHDLVFNFFLARTEVIRSVRGWDENLKLAEHTDFFLKAKAHGVRVGYCKDIWVKHKKERYMNDKGYRGRGGRFFRDVFMPKHNLTRVVGFDGAETNKTGLETIALCISTFERPDMLERLLMSIAEFQPDCKVYIADDSKKFSAKWYREIFERAKKAGLKKKPTAFNVPYDEGLSYKRNFLISKTEEPYLLFLDDDFVFRKETDIQKLHRILTMSSEFGIAGGGVLQDGTSLMKFHGKLDVEGDSLILSEQEDEFDLYQDTPVLQTDIIPNFFLAKREVFASVQWDDDIKIHGEHTDFFLRLKATNWRVLYVPNLCIEHGHRRNEDYEPFRKRGEFFADMLKKHGIKRLVTYNRAQEPDGMGGIKHYRV